MKTQMVFLMLVCLTTSLIGQAKFETGYFIDDTGKRVDCLIKNEDWRDNPIRFTYKEQEQAITQNQSIEEVVEFGVAEFRYRRFQVMIDRSSHQIAIMDNKAAPELKQETLFLRYLLEGETNLLLYSDGSLQRFFFQKSDNKPELLVYKKYKSKIKDPTKLNNKVIATNNRYKNQLLGQLPCNGIKASVTQKVLYTQKSLTNFFVKYHDCIQQEYILYKKKTKRKSFNVTLRPGLKFASCNLRSNRFPTRNIDFGTATNIRFGIEIEYVFPFNNNKWAIAVEPTYQSFKKNTVWKDEEVNLDYSSIEIPLLLRYYLNLSDVSKLFVNLGYTIDVGSNSFIEYSRSEDFDIDTSNNFNVGLGYKFQNQYGMELRYDFKRDLSSNLFFETNYSALSFILGYTF